MRSMFLHACLSCVCTSGGPKAAPCPAWCEQRMREMQCFCTHFMLCERGVCFMLFDRAYTCWIWSLRALCDRIPGRLSMFSRSVCHWHDCFPNVTPHSWSCLIYRDCLCLVLFKTTSYSARPGDEVQKYWLTRSELQ